MGNRKSRFRSKERVSKWRIDNLFNFDSIPEFDVDNENKSNAADLEHETDICISLEDADICNLSNIGSNLISLTDDRKSEEPSSGLFTSIIEKCSNSCRKSDTYPKSKQVNNSERDCKFHTNKHRVRFVTNEEDEQSIQKSNYFNSQLSENERNNFTNQQVFIEKDISEKLPTQNHRRCRAGFGGNECSLTTNTYGMRVPRSQIYKFKTSRANEMQSERKSNVKEIPIDKTNFEIPRPSIYPQYPKQQQQTTLSPRNNFQNHKGYLTFGIKNTKNNTYLIPKSLIIPQSRISPKTEGKMDQSTQCDIKACGDQIFPCNQQEGIQTNTVYFEQHRGRNSLNATATRQRSLPTVHKKLLSDQDIVGDYSHRSQLTVKSDDAPRNLNTQNMQTRVKHCLSEQGVAHIYSTINQLENESTPRADTTSNCVTIQSVRKSDLRRKPGLRRFSKHADEAQELSLKSNNSCRSHRPQANCRNFREDLRSCSKAPHSKSSIIPEMDRKTQYEINSCLESDERYLQYTPTEDEVTFSTESCGIIQSPSVQSRDLKSCHSNNVDWKKTDCSLIASEGNDNVSKSFNRTNANTSSADPSVKFEPCSKLHAKAENGDSCKQDNIKFTIIEVKSNIEELRRRYKNGRIIFCHRFFVKVNNDTRKIFTDSVDRRIESICRQSACRIHVKGLCFKKKWQEKFAELLIFAESLQELEKCCKLFDSTFPSFMASSGLGLKR